MFPVILALVVPAILWAQLRLPRQPAEDRFVALILAGYLARVAFYLIAADYPFFSYGAGGDSYHYDELSQFILRMWDVRGPFYATADDLPLLGRSSLPPNLFALVAYLNGEPSRFGCAVVMAYFGCTTVQIVRRTGLELGGDPDTVFKTSAVLLFSPAFILYSSDMYKDGLVIFLAVWGLSRILRLARAFDPLAAAELTLAMVMLYFCRFYLVFLVCAPLLVALVGGRSLVRNVLAVLFLVVVVLFAAGFTDVLAQATEAAGAAYDIARNPLGLAENARFGSGVDLEGEANVFGISLRGIFYTLFSPFLWQTGSLALHLGKIDTLIWYAMLYRAYQSARRLWSTDQSLLWCFATFIVLGVLMYSMIMTNIGLILRERLPVVFVTALLGFARARAPVTVAPGEPEPERERTSIEPPSEDAQAA